MNVHENARLTPKGREDMVRAVVEGGLTKAAAARSFNTTPKTVAKWVGRFREGGAQALRHGWFASPFLFPGTGKSGYVSVKADNGHECRRTYYSTRFEMGVPSEFRKKLMDHTLTKVDAAYFSDSLTWGRLVETQEAITRQLHGDVDVATVLGQ